MSVVLPAPRASGEDRSAPARGRSIVPKFDADDPYSIALALLISADLVFVGVHLVHTFTDHLSSSMYALQTDRGHAEVFQYVKAYWIVALFGILASRRRALIYVSWLLVFTYLLMDDAFAVHETFGGYAASALAIEPMLGLRAQDIGELLVTLVAATPLFALVALGYVRSDAHQKTFSRYLLAMFLGLAFFGVFVDMLGVILHGGAFGEAMTAIEDGGEMVVLSVMLWFVFRHSFADPQLRGSRSLEIV